ncbi:hypothetical protein [Roseibium aestuarii]|uniref:Uncharacterized protein n=1 Tax=Roseibium aestuarii TaxID=2600299 RepID=A0ABW4JPC4_9HYPH|nr:hypothetical protein [Roseibium aestuarii]
MCADVMAHEQDDLFSKPEFDLSFTGLQPTHQAKTNAGNELNPG